MRKRQRAVVGVMGATGVLGLVMLSLGAPDGCGSTSRDVVDRDGAVLISEDGMFVLDIPAGALSSEVELAIEKVSCGQDHEAACYDVLPHGVVFERPATATYEAADLMTMDSVSLAVSRDDAWRPLADIVVDREDDIVSGSVLYSSSFCVQAR